MLSVFAGSVALLCACVGQRSAEAILTTGAMLDGQRALELGLADILVAPETVLRTAMDEAQTLGRQDGIAFASIKRLLRRPIAEQIARDEESSIHEFVEIWYSESTRRQLNQIEIRS